MAKTVTGKTASQAANKSKSTSTTEVKETKIETKVEATSTEPVKSGPSYDELLSLVQQLATEVQTLKSGAPAPSVSSAEDANTTNKILELLSNRRSDREVTIVHNCELLGGLSTHIELTGMIIDFHTMGEQRLLSWQQFEECVSKYRGFFEREIILLSDNDSNLAVKYNVPCVKRGNNNVLTSEIIAKLPTMSATELEDCVNGLTESDKDFIMSYWLGKCYEKTPGFYDRYKVERLNNLSQKRVFDNLLTLMNGDFREENK